MCEALDLCDEWRYHLKERSCMVKLSENSIEIPAEDERTQGRDVVGRLKRSMYGTQDAPAVWQREVGQMLQDRGFLSSRTLACMYYNVETELKIVLTQIIVQWWARRLNARRC